MLIELQKSPTSIDSFKKNVRLWSGTMREQINVTYEVIVPLIPLWPSFRRQPGILNTSPLSFPNRFSTSRHTLRGPKIVKPLTKKSGKKEKSLKRLVTVLITSALKRLTWTMPQRQLSNKFRISSTLSPSEKNLCRLYSTQKVRSIPFDVGAQLLLLRNWASESGQLLKIPWRDILGG